MPELYYAIVNIMDWHGKNDIPLSYEMFKAVYQIALQGKIDCSSFADANDCGKCNNWYQIADAFRELWKKGERV